MMFANLKQKLNVTSEVTNVHRTESSRHVARSPNRKNSDSLSITSSSIVEDCSSVISNRSTVSKQVLSNLLVEKSREIESLKTKAKELTEMLQECAVTIDCLNADKKQCNKKLERLKSEEEIDESLHKLREDNQTLTLANTRLRNDNAKLIKQLDTLNSSYQMVQQKDSDHNECLLRQMESEHKTTLLEETIARLQESQILTETEKSSLITELDMSSDKITKCETQVQSLEKKCVFLTEECTSKDSKLEHVSTQLNSSHNELKVITEDKISLQHSLEQLKTSHDNKDLEYLNLEKQLLGDKEDNKTSDCGDYNAKIASLQEQCDTLGDEVYTKNKIIKNEQMKLKDLKKLMQKELNIRNIDLDNNPVIVDSKYNGISSSNSGLIPPKDKTIMNSFGPPKKSDGNSNLNLEYIRHVILKFLLSTESESLQLVKALSTLLRFSREEEAILSSTLQWRQSWFGGHRPKLSNRIASFRNS